VLNTGIMAGNHHIPEVERLAAQRTWARCHLRLAQPGGRLPIYRRIHSGSIPERAVLNVSGGVSMALTSHGRWRAIISARL
jgi:hypothetical protein